MAPEDLFQRLEHVYNFGKIVAGGEICAILQVKSKTRKGTIENLDAPKEEMSASEREAYVVQNVGYLKL